MLYFCRWELLLHGWSNNILFWFASSTTLKWQPAQTSKPSKKTESHLCKPCLGLYGRPASVTNDKVNHSARPAKRPLAGPTWPTQVSGGSGSSKQSRGQRDCDSRCERFVDVLCQVQPTPVMDMSCFLLSFSQSTVTCSGCVIRWNSK